MNHKIVNLTPRKLVGINKKMSMANNLTGQLWREFGPRIKEIQNRSTEDKISMQVYPALYYEQFNLNTPFTKWATVEVHDFNTIPLGMEPFILDKSLYAVFDYKGSSADNTIYQYIFYDWLPKSNYILDNKPHFEVLGPKYKNNDSQSEEAIWIPIKIKNESLNKLQ